MPQRVGKDPDAKLDYVFDFAAKTNGDPDAKSDWLPAGDTIATYTLTPDAGITVASHAKTHNDTCVTYWLTGGTLGQYYRVTCHVVTAAGREEDRTMTIRMEPH